MPEQALELSSCLTCEADIVWLRTRSGRNMPVDADSVEPGDTEFDSDRHVSHFSTCPDAGRHRRR